MFVNVNVLIGLQKSIQEYTLYIIANIPTFVHIMQNNEQRTEIDTPRRGSR